MEKFIAKNYKWIIAALFLLFAIKNTQSCNRATTITKNNHQIDSLTVTISNKVDTINILKRELTYSTDKFNDANRRADDVVKAVSSAKTTVVIKNQAQSQDKNK